MTTTSPTSSPPTRGSALDRLFATLRTSSVVRSPDRVLGGVCAGLAERGRTSVGVVRVLAVVLATLGPGVLLYLLAWLLLPARDGRVRLERAIRDGDPASVVLLVVTGLVLVPDALLHPHLAWLPFLVVGLLAVAAFRSAGRRECGGSASRRYGSGPAPARPDVRPGHHGDDGRPQDAPRT